ncbi:MAG: Isocitrate lyase, partial [uncultured Gemmatimonadaceae bacterium]
GRTGSGRRLDARPLAERHARRRASARGAGTRPRLAPRRPLRRRHAPVLDRRRRAPAGVGAHRAHPRPARRRAAVGAAHRARLRPRVRRPHRRPGRADGARRARGHLPLRLAGRGRRQPRRADLPRPVALPGQLGAQRRPAHQPGAAARRRDRGRRGEARRPPLVRADRGRRRGRLRRPAQRVRADEGHDRGRRRGRALRGPALEREEVRPPRRQGARAHGALRAHARRGAPRGRRARRAHRARRPHRRRQRAPPHERRRRARPPVHHRRAHQRGLLPDHRRHRDGHRPRPRLRALRRPAVVRDEHARPRGGEAVRRGRARRVPGQDARLQLLAVVQLAPQPRRRHHREVPARARRDGLQVPVRHAGRLPPAQLRHVRARARLPRARHGRLRRPAGPRVRRRGAGLHGDEAPARGGHRVLRRGVAGDLGRPGVDARAARLDRGGAVPRAL